jgi:cytochrome P450
MTTDPPLHRKLRGLVNNVFTPRMVAGLESRIRQIVREELDRIVPSQPFEFVESLAVPLPMYVIAEMLGVPASDRPLFSRLTMALTVLNRGEDGFSPELMMQFLSARQELFDYFEEKLSEREQSPKDDLMSGLLVAELDGERLSRENQLMMCILLLAAGNETTRNLISGSVIALAEHPDQRQKLVKEPALLESAVDELLRWVTPLNVFCRTATEDTQIRDQPIKAGDYVALLYMAANRDEDVWDAPDVFDVTRRVDPAHLAFGWGEHRCLGASLARLEARVFFEEFLSRCPEFELTGPPVRSPSVLTQTIDSVPIVVAA